jgi:hypothetical protein
MDLKAIGHESVDWIHLAQDRDQWWTPVNTVMNLIRCVTVAGLHGATVMQCH